MRNFYQPVLVKIYRDSAIMEAWLSFQCRTSDQNCEARVFECTPPCPPRKDNTKHSSQQNTWNNINSMKQLSTQWKVHVHQERLLQLCFVDMACSLRFEPRNEANMATQHQNLTSGHSYIQYPVPLQ